MNFIRNSTFGLVVFLLSACGGGSGSAPGTTSTGPDGFTKIIDGIRISPSDAPEIVAVIVEGRASNRGGISTELCSGSVISPTKVLTAAHCFSLRQITSVMIYNETNSFPANAVWVHPGYNAAKQGSINSPDLAIVQSADTLPLSTMPIFASHQLSTAEPLFVYGYGRSTAKASSVGTLNAGLMYIDAVTQTSIFTSYHRGDSSDTCFGDSGGPALAATFDSNGNVTQYGLVGVISSGSSGTCADGDQNRFVNVQWSSAMDFIRSVAPDAQFD